MSCDGGEEGLVPVPSDIGTEFLLIGTAPAGRGISASSARVLRATELETVAPDPIAGGDVDMLVAGLDPDDFPIDLPPDQLRFVSDGDERARPLPMLHAPHVFEEPAPFDHPSLLVPVEQEDVPKEFLADREDRLERMLSGFAIENPCVEPVTPFSIFTPRIPAEAIIAMRTLSSGETFVGFSATSTAIIGVLGPSDIEPEIIGVTTSTETPELMGEVVDIPDLGDGEVTAAGRVLPNALALNVSDGFGSVGSVAFWSEARQRWVDDTPPLEAFPRYLYGARRVRVDGTDSVCTFGAVQGSDRSGGIWCRPEAGGTWTLRGRFTRQFGVRGMRQDAAGNLLAFDLAGSVYEHAGDDAWSQRFTSALNAGCDPLCANFGALTFGDASDLFGVVAGSKAQVLFLQPDGGSVVAVEPEVVREALFVDERVDADMPIHFTATTIAPDGAVWLGTSNTPDLFRISPDRSSVTRICIPKELKGMSIGALEAHPSGRLIIGMAPAIFAFSDWRL